MIHIGTATGGEGTRVPDTPPSGWDQPMEENVHECVKEILDKLKSLLILDFFNLEMSIYEPWLHHWLSGN